MPTPAPYAVYIGRFQPFHNGHLHVVRQALSRRGDLIIVLGSSHGPRTIKNPFSALEREDMIRACLTEAENLRTHFVAVEDSAYNDTAWALDVTNAVQSVAGSAPVALIGHEKDATTFYLRMFPQWEFVEVGSGGRINATDIRAAYFASLEGRGVEFIIYTPDEVREYLEEFQETDAYEQLAREFDFVQRYRASWDAAPYPPTFVTVDAVVVQQGHILLIQRRAEPGAGLWALPGGFLDGAERIEDAMLRELREETRLKVPEPVLRGNIITSRVFDAPDRSARGRTITHAYLVHLPPHGAGLPEVKGSSDAAKAQWWPLSEVKRSMMFEDHMDILKNLTASL